VECPRQPTGTCGVVWPPSLSRSRPCPALPTDSELPTPPPLHFSGPLRQSPLRLLGLILRRGSFYTVLYCAVLCCTVLCCTHTQCCKLAHRACGPPAPGGGAHDSAHCLRFCGFVYQTPGADPSMPDCREVGLEGPSRPAESSPEGEGARGVPQLSFRGSRDGGSTAVGVGRAHAAAPGGPPAAAKPWKPAEGQPSRVHSLDCGQGDGDGRGGACRWSGLAFLQYPS
jgi:hypothetical protein